MCGVTRWRFTMLVVLLNRNQLVLKMPTWSLTYRESVFQWQQSKNISKSFTYKMAAKTSWHRCRTKLRHGHPVYRRPTCVVFARPLTGKHDVIHRPEVHASPPEGPTTATGNMHFVTFRQLVFVKNFLRYAKLPVSVDCLIMDLAL